LRRDVLDDQRLPVGQQHPLEPSPRFARRNEGALLDSRIEHARSVTGIAGLLAHGGIAP
jgi:hypothetical protein